MPIGMITNIANIGMNYVNYKTTIVQKHHVQLLGWPSMPFVNPHLITTVATISSLHHALTVATCKWVVLTKRQQKEHAAAMAKEFKDGPAVNRKCKVQADKGKKWKAIAPTDSDEEGEDHSEGSEVSRKHKVQADKGKKRKAIAPTDSDEEGEDQLEASQDNEDDTVLPLPPKKKKMKAPAKALSSKNAQAPAMKPTKRAKHVASRLSPTAPKCKPFITASDSEESD